MVDEKIKLRIYQLLLLEKRGATIHERETAGKQAKALLVKHGLKPKDCVPRDVSSKEPEKPTNFWEAIGAKPVDGEAIRKAQKEKFDKVVEFIKKPNIHDVKEAAKAFARGLIKDVVKY